ncbi:MAG: hypothetical protein MJZ85_08295 [Bacteroidales bacterium]|nr:hypothetical protein [Bacteroidales bacterium]
MNKLNIYYCSKCGNVGITYGKPSIECCGSKIEPVFIENGNTTPAITEMDGEYFLEYTCPMTKDDYIAAVVSERYDRIELIRLFPEQAAEVRVAQVKGTKIYTVFCRHGKVWCEVMK